MYLVRLKLILGPDRIGRAINLLKAFRAIILASVQAGAIIIGERIGPRCESFVRCLVQFVCIHLCRSVGPRRAGLH